ncbi:hypothetical protein HC251_07030 [Iamia sp. SCSIO 61187]|uniref:hypothetical protein n=1 Tax=Iamia sp. SCSIO 61187 TaxID=2722752 RepID=UPI001C62EF02|nr:hypothetical protein [Iamia sp. SCSIO 61187]QYG92216.1 hypothetical protein HC251_07030 [Iamia sp. SCSIO 61187]
MSLGARRLAYVAGIAAIMPLSGWAGTYTAWRTVLGDDVGQALAVFFDLQVETWSTVILLAPIIDLVYGLHRTDRGWDLAPRRGMARAATYAALAVLVLVCAAEGPLRDVLGVAAPDDVAASVAHYFRRALEGVLTVMGVMLFLDLVIVPSRRRAPAPAPAPT